MLVLHFTILYALCDFWKSSSTILIKSAPISPSTFQRSRSNFKIKTACTETLPVLIARPWCKISLSNLAIQQKQFCHEIRLPRLTKFKMEEVCTRSVLSSCSLNCWYIANIDTELMLRCVMLWSAEKCQQISVDWRSISGWTFGRHWRFGRAPRSTEEEESSQSSPDFWYHGECQKCSRKL